MGRIVAIHADCDDLRFLRPLQGTLAKWVGNHLDWHCLNSLQSHSPAKEALQRKKGLALILLHGRSDGFRAGDYGASPDDDTPAMFLKRGEMKLFGESAVFCLSCKGSEHGEEIIQKGASVFLGFDDVPFSRFDPVTGNEIYRHSLTQHCQRLIISTLSSTLERLIVKGESFEGIAKFLKLSVQRSALEFVRQNESEEYRNDVAHLFLKMAETVKVFGRGKLTLRDCS